MNPRPIQVEHFHATIDASNPQAVVHAMTSLLADKQKEYRSILAGVSSLIVQVFKQKQDLILLTTKKQKSVAQALHAEGKY